MVYVLILLVVYQIKHFLCDYPLQGRYMLGKFKGGHEWVLPLLAHSGVHAVATFLISFVFICFRLSIESTGLPFDYALISLFALKLAMFDMVVHFTMDRIKASPNLLGRYKALDANCYVGIAEMAETGTCGSVKLTEAEYAANKLKAKDRLKSNTYFWWALGLDQAVHHLTHYVIIAVLLS